MVKYRRSPPPTDIILRHVARPRPRPPHLRRLPQSVQHLFPEQAAAGGVGARSRQRRAAHAPLCRQQRAAPGHTHVRLEQPLLGAHLRHGCGMVGGGRLDDDGGGGGGQQFVGVPWRTARNQPTWRRRGRSAKAVHMHTSIAPDTRWWWETTPSPQQIP